MKSRQTSGNWDPVDTESCRCIATLKFYCDSVKDYLKNHIAAALVAARKESFRRLAPA